MKNGLGPEQKDKFLVSTDYIYFLSIIIGGGFTVLAIILTFADSNQISNFGFLFYSVLFLIFSIFSSLESLGGFIWYKRTLILKREDLNYFYYGSVFWYIGVYTLLLSILYLLISVNLLVIAIISYYILFSSMINWTSSFLFICKELEVNVNNKKEEIKKLREVISKAQERVENMENELDNYKCTQKLVKSLQKKIFQIKFYKILLYTFTLLGFIVFYDLLGLVIFVRFLSFNGIIIHLITYIIFWILKIIFK